MSEQPIIPPVPGEPITLEPSPEVLALEVRVAAAEARAEAAENAVAALSDKPVRYAAYDNRTHRFVGPVFDKKPSNTILKGLLKGDDSVTDDLDDLTIREV